MDTRQTLLRAAHLEHAAELIVGTVTDSRLTSKYTVHSAEHPRPPYMRVALMGLGFPDVDAIIADVTAAHTRGELRVLPCGIMGIHSPTPAEYATTLGESRPRKRSSTASNLGTRLL